MYESLLGFIPMFFMQKLIKDHKPHVYMSLEEDAMANSMSLKVGNSTQQNRDNAPNNHKSDTPESPQSPSAIESQANLVRLLSVSHEGNEFQALPTNTSPRAQTDIGADGGENITDTIDAAPTEQLYSLLTLRNDQISNHINDNPDKKHSNINISKATMGETKGESKMGMSQELSIAHVASKSNDADLVKLTIVYQIKERLYNDTYKLPHWCKYLSMTCIVIWSLLCAIITTIWCLWFDVQLTLTNNYEQSVMINGTASYYIPLKSKINYNVTQSEIDDILSYWESNGHSLYTPPENDSFTSGSEDGMSVSVRFLMAVLLSYCLSIFLWQPIILAIKSLIRLIKLDKNPNQINEALLFYNEHNVNINAAMESTVKYTRDDNGNGVGGDNADNKDNDVNQDSADNDDDGIIVMETVGTPADIHNELQMTERLPQNQPKKKNFDKSFEVTSGMGLAMKLDGETSNVNDHQETNDIPLGNDMAVLLGDILSNNKTENDKQRDGEYVE